MEKAITKTALDKLRVEGKTFQECADHFGITLRVLKKWRDENSYVDVKPKAKDRQEN